MTAPVDHNPNRPTRTPNFKQQQIPVVLDHHPAAAVRGTFLEKDAKLVADVRAPVEAAHALRGQLNHLLDTNVDRQQLAAAATSRMGEVTRMFDKVVPALEARRAAVQRDMDRVFTPAAADTAAGEIRSHVKGSKEPFSEAMKIVESNDLRSATALLGAPSFLSGLSREQIGTLRTYAEQRFAGEHHGMLQDLDRTIANVKRIGEQLVRDVGGAINGWSSKDAATIQKVLG
jgi:hypothetical protein